MYKDDSGRVEHGDMLWNRSNHNIQTRTIFKLFFRLSKYDRFKLELYIDERYDFSEIGFSIKVLRITGHSLGSIGILTTDGELLCGDLLTNVKKPDIWSIIDDSASVYGGIEELKRTRSSLCFRSMVNLSPWNNLRRPTNEIYRDLHSCL